MNRKLLNMSEIEKNTWFQIGASVKGKNHLQENTPCQDNHYYKRIHKNWHMAIVADGAGSYNNAHLGAAFVVKNAFEVFKVNMITEDWFKQSKAPSAEVWRHLSIMSLKQVYDNLKVYATQNNYSFKSLSSTIILMVYGSNVLMMAHIGDGRAAVLTNNNDWQAAMTPAKGSEVGTTWFLSSDSVWHDPHATIETRVWNEPVKAFAMLTDGLENYCFHCYTKDEVSSIYSDPNMPLNSFFNQNIEHLKSLKDLKTPKHTIKKMLQQYLKNGREEYVNEGDDRTLVLGFR
jgi:serine/threonine protein phosphatase PrpC